MLSERVALICCVIRFISFLLWNSIEGTLTTKPPFLDGTNCAYWKIRMIAFLRVIDDEVWDVVEEGYVRHTVTVYG